VKRILWILLVSVCFGQNLPDSPSTVVEKKCGPKWAGGCYVAPKKSNWETVKDPYFIWPRVFEWALTGADIGISVSAIDASRGCLEGNTFLGKNPSNAKVIGVTIATETAVTLFRFAASKSTPNEPRNKVGKVARWISPALAGFSVYKHGNGIRQWAQSGCL